MQKLSIRSLLFFHFSFIQISFLQPVPRQFNSGGGCGGYGGAKLANALGAVRIAVRAHNRAYFGYQPYVIGRKGYVAGSSAFAVSSGSLLCKPAASMERFSKKPSRGTTPL